MRKLPITEDAFKDAVLDLAALHGWKRQHSRPARKKDGTWSTPIQGDKGFPDLVLARGGVVLFRELKTDTGKLRPDQVEWFDALGLDESAVWRPRDWNRIEEELA